MASPYRTALNRLLQRWSSSDEFSAKLVRARSDLRRAEMEHRAAIRR